MRRTMFMLVFMGTALALAAGVALAQATTEHFESSGPIEFVETRECIGEPVRISGLLHTTSQVTQDAAGGFHAVTHFNFANVQGTGELSGGQYRVQTTLNSPIHSNSGEGFPLVQTDELTHNVIGQGQLANFRLRSLLHITINENGTVTAVVDRVTAECRNGSQL